MPERVAQHLLRLGVRFGEDHNLDMDAIKSLIRKCELARVPFSIRAGVFHVGEESLAAVREEVEAVEEKVDEVLDEADKALEEVDPTPEVADGEPED